MCRCAKAFACYLLPLCCLVLFALTRFTCGFTLQETGKDPITGEAASLDDLVAVKTNKVRPGLPLPVPCVWQAIWLKDSR